jgi:hypothetical protein
VAVGCKAIGIAAAVGRVIVEAEQIVWVEIGVVVVNSIVDHADLDAEPRVVLPAFEYIDAGSAARQIPLLCEIGFGRRAAVTGWSVKCLPQGRDGLEGRCTGGTSACTASAGAGASACTACATRAGTGAAPGVRAAASGPTASGFLGITLELPEIRARGAADMAISPAGQCSAGDAKM